MGWAKGLPAQVKSVGLNSVDSTLNVIASGRMVRHSPCTVLWGMSRECRCVETFVLERDAVAGL